MNTSQPARNNRWLPLAAVAVLALLLGAGGDDPARREQNRRRIEQMSAADRAHLEYQFQRWLAMQEADRNRYRKLHEDLERTAQNDEDLHAVMNAYGEWLKTLSPWQRDELRKAPDVPARLALVRQFKTEQEQRKQARLLIASGPGERPDRNWGAPPLSIEEIDAMLGTLRVRRPFPTETGRHIDALMNPHRQVRTLLEYLKINEQRPGLSQHIDENMADQMIKAIEHDRVRDWLQSIDDDDRRRHWVAGVLVRGIVQAAEQELDRRRPGEEELAEVFVNLPTETQDEIARMPNEVARRRMTFHYFQQSEDPFTKDFGELRRLMEQSFRGDPRGRSGQRPGSDGRDNDRGRDERSRDERDGHDRGHDDRRRERDDDR